MVSYWVIPVSQGVMSFKVIHNNIPNG